MAVFDYCGSCDSPLETIPFDKILFRQKIHSDPIRARRWAVIGSYPLSREVLTSFKVCSHTPPSAKERHKSDGSWYVESIDPEKDKLYQGNSEKVSKEECQKYRQTGGTFWRTEDDLRKHFLGMEPLGLTDEIKQFYRSLTPGIPAVVGEFGTLNNDDAYSWLSMVKETDDLSLLKKAFLEGEDEDFLDIPEANFMLAAAELVLALLGRQRNGVKTFAGAWVKQIKRKKLHQSETAKELLPLAIEAIDRVLADNSHLAQEMQGQKQWEKGITDLQKKLKALE